MAQSKVTKFAKLTIDDDENEETPPPEVKLSLGKTKKVVMDRSDTVSTIGSIIHLSLYDRIRIETQKILDKRSQLQIHELIDNKRVNVTPKPIDLPHETEGYKKLTRKYSAPKAEDGLDIISFKSMTSTIMKSRSSRGVGFKLSLEDIINGIGSERMLLDLESARHSMASFDSSSSSLSLSDAHLVGKHKLPFIRIILRKTELQLLYEQRSMTAIKNTEDANFVEMDNKQYDYLTIGRGKVRRRSESEAQTSNTLYKARGINTDKTETRDVASYVSFFEMYDTYMQLDDIEYGFNEYETKKLHISQSQTNEEQFAMIAKLPSFHLASDIIKRLLAGNTYEEGQRRFRNMMSVTRTMDKIIYKYSLKPLFNINRASKDNIRKAVSDMSFCYTNGDILAVSYGIYSYQAAKLPNTGEVCVWSIKNPCDPERFYSYEVPVVSVEFSPYMPSLLAIGLFDGTVEVRDIAFYNQPPVAISQRITSPGVDPVLAIKWIKQTSANGQEDVDPFITLSQDGSVTQFNIINSPFLSGFRLMTLERIEGIPEGLPGIKSSTDLPQQTNRCAQGLNLTKHPTHLDIYYVLTDEGCIHKCSTNYQHHYLQVLKTHEGSVNAMDFSPWSPKLFLTCGNDWCIRIWMDGIFQPLITLKNISAPYQWAAWSRVHSTVIIAINRKQCEIWDLKRNILKPMSTTCIGKSYNTMGIFSLNGCAIAIGTERGQVVVSAFDEMPFPPYYQYDTLEKAIYKAVNNFPELVIELKSVGYFGYPNKGFVKPP
ncbi:dynein axonemal intermediate chain 4 [Lucilia cuprina]|uniref:dynein axonemal intermediate chain 4 n=1 Tax=Lucilia cuprina TaxID=7375 RepID=UPI001F0705CC|nr:dynein axonemal intermediate chain 4 [Lucilia cuprina]